jgi:lipopolysaccharide heptosyltransferase III
VLPPEPARAPAPPAVPVDRARVRSILVIRHRAGGDLLLTTPALRALRAGFPAARIDVVAARGLGSLLAGNPDVDRVLEFDRRSLLSQAGLYLRLARGGYGVVIDPVSTPRTAFMTRLTRAPVRVGYDIAGRRGAYGVRVPREPLDGAGRPALRYAPEAAMDLVRALGIPARDLSLRFEVLPEARARIDAWLAEEGLAGARPASGAGARGSGGGARPLVACLPVGSWPAKTWPPERFAAAMDDIAASADVLWLWGPGEREGVEACRARMRSPSRLGPATDWQGLGAILSRCSLLVGNDSGPKHVAVALGVPTVTIYGPTNPATWHPPSGPHEALFAEGLDCLFCNANRCPLPGERHMRCMADVPVERVVRAARALLGGALEAPCGSR